MEHSRPPLQIRSAWSVAAVALALLAGCIEAGGDDRASTLDGSPAATAPPAATEDDSSEPADPSPDPDVVGPDRRPVEKTVSEGTIAYLAAYQEGGGNHSDGVYLGSRAELPASTFEVEVSMSWTAASPAEWRVCLPYFTAPDADVVVSEGSTGCWLGSDGVSFKARFFEGETSRDGTSMLSVFVHDAPTADAAAMADAHWTVTAYHYA